MADYERQASNPENTSKTNQSRCELSGIPRINPAKPQAKNSAEGLRKASGR